MKSIFFALGFFLTVQVSFAQPCILDVSPDSNSVTAKGEIIEGRRHGVWISENAYGAKIEKQYDHGKLHGLYKVTRKTGQLMETGRYENDLKEGPWVNYFPNSDTLILTTYKQGHKEGPYVRYQDNGKLLYMGSFKKNKMDGLWIEYPVHVPGQRGYLIRTEYTYKDGVLDGTTITYYTTKTTTQWYKNGVLQRTQDVPIKDSESVISEVPQEIAPTTAVEEEEEVEPVLAFAEEMPSFPGGQTAMEKYFQDSLRYPQAEKDSAIGGTVYVYFEVAQDGSIGNVITKKGVPGHPNFQKEAIRVIQRMPRWNPGKVNGRPVKVSMTVPVKFEVGNN